MITAEPVTPELLRDWRLPGPSGSKRTRGDLVVVGGAARSPGAAALAGLAALRVGAGRVQLAVAASVAPALAVTFPEAGVIGLPESTHGSISGPGAAELCARAVNDTDTVLLGPGLDDVEETAVLLERLLPQIPDGATLVLDAYALGVLPRLRAQIADRTSPPVLTPNGEELARLLGRECESFHDDVAEVAERYACCNTASALVADPSGHRWRIPSGHPGLATAGSGDVLAGAIAGLLARGADPAQATCWGTYLHSTAGERLASTVAGVGFLARELVDQLAPLVAELA